MLEEKNKSPITSRERAEAFWASPNTKKKKKKRKEKQTKVFANNQQVRNEEQNPFGPAFKSKQRPMQTTNKFVTRYKMKANYIL